MGRESGVKKFLKDALRDLTEFAFFSLGLAVFLLLFHQLIGVRLFNIVLQYARIEDDAVAKFMLFIYTVSSSILILLFYWMAWESAPGQKLYRKYICKLVVKDYYKDHKRLNIDGALGSLAKLERRGFDADEDKKDAVLDGMHDSQFRVFFSDEDLILPQFRTDGTHVLKYDNENPKLEVTYLKGKRHGIYRTYYEDGTLHQEKFYKAGMLDGVYRAFDENGVLYFEITYKGDKQHGFDKIYNKYGNLVFCDTYFEGVRLNRKTYDERGKMVFSQDFAPPPSPEKKEPAAGG